jgi:hypothetical protein
MKKHLTGDLKNLDASLSCHLDLEHVRDRCRDQTAPALDLDHRRLGTPPMMPVDTCIEGSTSQCAIPTTCISAHDLRNRERVRIKHSGPIRMGCSSIPQLEHPHGRGGQARPTVSQRPHSIPHPIPLRTPLLDPGCYARYVTTHPHAPRSLSASHNATLTSPRSKSSTAPV